MQEMEDLDQLSQQRMEQCSERRPELMVRGLVSTPTLVRTVTSSLSSTALAEVGSEYWRETMFQREQVVKTLLLMILTIENLYNNNNNHSHNNNNNNNNNNSINNHNNNINNNINNLNNSSMLNSSITMPLRLPELTSTPSSTLMIQATET